MAMGRRVAWVLLLVAACSNKPSPSADPAPSPAPPPGPPPAQWSIFYEASSGEWAEISSETGPAEIEPTHRFAVKNSVSVNNSRIRLFDEADKVMVSDDELLVPPERPNWEYQIQLPLALKTGHKYTLVIDAQQGDSFSDEFNRPLLEKRVELKVAGEKEKPPPPEKPKRKRRRN